MPCTTATDADVRCGLYGQLYSAKAPKFVPQVFVRVVHTFLYVRFVRQLRRRLSAKIRSAGVCTSCTYVFVRMFCTSTAAAPKRQNLFRRCLYELYVRFCTYVSYVNCIAADVLWVGGWKTHRHKKSPPGKPSYGFPRPFPRLENTRKNFKGASLIC